MATAAVFFSHGEFSMSNIIYAVVSLLICGAAVLIFALTFSPRKKKSKPVYLRAFCVCLVIWVLGTAMLYVIPDRELALKVHLLKYVGIAFGPALAFQHVRSQLVGRQRWWDITGLLLIVPVITAAISISPLRWLLVTNVYYISEPPARMVMMEYGPWFYIHCVYSYALIVTASLLLIKTFVLMPKYSRRPIILMMTGMLALVLSNIIVVFNFVYFQYDITIYGSVMLLVMFYLVLGVMSTANIVITSRQWIYNNFSSMIMVLDAEKLVIDCNPKAKMLLSGLGMPETGFNFDDFNSRWIKLQNGRISEYDNSILTVETGGSEQHYRIIIQECEENGEVVGYFAEIQEITQLYSMFRLLEESATYDKLTGLFNRNSYTERLSAWSGEDVLPLGIVFGDVNLLKRVNDKYGHLVGDEMLKAAAAAILDSSPERAFAARIGGDEFAVLIPNSSREELDSLCQRIHERFAEHNAGEFGGAGIALGSVLRGDISEDLRQMLREADRLMYSDKYDRRKKGASQ